jgi:glucose/arabinose dehydrogenase/plastocyanin
MIPAAAPAAATQDVDIINFTFSPASVTAQMGDAVRWVQRDPDPIAHTSTSGVGGVPNGLWESGLLINGASFYYTFNNPGTYPYFCAVHTGMTGHVIVPCGANFPPEVSITSPTNGASFQGSTAFTIEATASSTAINGTISQVEFFDGAASLGLDSVSPFSISTNLHVGSHALTAVVTDSQCGTSTSAPVNVTITGVPIVNPIAQRIPKGDITIELQTVVDRLASPLGMAVPDDGSNRIFVYDQSGLGWLVQESVKLAIPLLDVRNRLVPLEGYDERGLLGMATHPQFAQNPLIYTYTSEPSSGSADFPSTLEAGVTNDHQSVIAEWRIDPASTNQVDPASRRELLRIDQPQANHNGGTLRFGPDGFLYVSLGDGGAADDQGNGHSAGGNGQDTNSILGKVLRIDVNGTNSFNGQYGIPGDNPFVGGGGLEEIYAYGFRNPYSFSFDRLTGELYLGDVGQNDIEEIDLVTKGVNFGWGIKEGTFYFEPNGAGPGYVTDSSVRPLPPDSIDPIAEYDHDDGLAIVGGYVYRGSQISSLQGRYLLGDWGDFTTPSGRLYYLDAGNILKEFHLGLEDRPLGFWLKGFGQDATGELYVLVSRVLGPSGDSGRVLKIVPAPDAITIINVGISGTNLATSWTGGIGPFALQKKTSLSDTSWMNQTFTAQRNALTPLEGSAGFFRVLDSSPLKKYERRR